MHSFDNERGSSNDCNSISGDDASDDGRDRRNEMRVESGFIASRGAGYTTCAWVLADKPKDGIVMHHMASQLAPLLYTYIT